MPAPRHIFRIHVRASADQVWQAITDPAFTERYFHHTTIESAWEVGAGVRYLMPDGPGGSRGSSTRPTASRP